MNVLNPPNWVILVKKSGSNGRFWTILACRGRKGDQLNICKVSMSHPHSKIVHRNWIERTSSRLRQSILIILGNGQEKRRHMKNHITRACWSFGGCLIILTCLTTPLNSYLVLPFRFTHCATYLNSRIKELLTCNLDLTIEGFQRRTRGQEICSLEVFVARSWFLLSLNIKINLVYFTGSISMQKYSYIYSLIYHQIYSDSRR